MEVIDMMGEIAAASLCSTIWESVKQDKQNGQQYVHRGLRAFVDGCICAHAQSHVKLYLQVANNVF